MINVFKYKPKGDKKNSEFFDEYRVKIFERRQSSGLEVLFGDMFAVVVQVQTGEGIAYLCELYMMTPYRYNASFISKTHKIYFLTNHLTSDAPIFIVLEPLNPFYKDDFTRLNRIYPNSREKFNARYIGEIYKNKDIQETKKILTSQDFHFHDTQTIGNPFFCNDHFIFTRISDLTYNCVGYTNFDHFDINEFNIGQRFTLTSEQQTLLDSADGFSDEKGIKPLIKGIDHLATRILAGEREDAILEFLCLSKYYFWGAYNITDMNSSTNVTRVPHGNDIQSPAKVFTANNTPFMVNSFKGLPMPTETFVRNYGRRLHHMAYEIVDGNYDATTKNIDFVIGTLRDQGHVEFLAQIFGECTDVPDLKQIFSRHSKFSLLITEYVERCHGFDGFFTKENVAALTESASLDERLGVTNKPQGVVGD